MADHIQIGDISPRVRTLANGVHTTFTFPFPIFRDEDLQVFVEGTRKTLTSDYTVSGAGNSDGGAVTFIAAPEAGNAVAIVRRLTIARTTDFQSSGEFRAKVINDELDFQTATLQQIEDDLGRTIRLQKMDAASSFELPDAATRAGRALTFDDSGNVSLTAFADLTDGAVLSSSVPLVDSDTGSAGFSNTLSAADHAHPIPALADFGIASQSEAESGADDTKAMTPLRTAQAIAARAANSDPVARDMAASALAYAMTTNDAVSVLGSVGKFWLSDDFESDSLAVKTNATYDPVGDLYENPPTYTADQCSGGTASGSTEYTPATLAFNGSAENGNAWYNYPAAVVGAWLRYNFAAEKAIARYTIQAANTANCVRTPTGWLLQGWNGAGWDVLHTVTGEAAWTQNEKRTYDIPSPSTYSDYRLYVTAASASDGWVMVGEMEMMEVIASDDMTLAPASVTLDAADPHDILGYFVIAPGTANFDTNGDGDAGDDIIGKISIDNGTTWAVAVWTKIGDIGLGDEQLWRLEADVSGQSGSSLIWEITTANAQQVAVHDCMGLIASY